MSFIKLNELNAQQCVSEFANRCVTSYRSVGVSRAGIESNLSDTEDATMPWVKQLSKQKHTTKASAVKVLGAAGLGLSLVGSASASTTPTAGIPQSDNTSPNQRFVLGEEEMADVSLATFHLFDRENFGSGVQLARGCGGCGCGGCRGCGGCGGFRGCGGGGFVGCRGCGGCRACGGCRGCGGCGFGIGFGFGGCVGCAACAACAGCCLSWGACRLC
jgi:hypothetical protein